MKLDENIKTINEEIDKLENIGGYIGIINYRLTLSEKVKNNKNYKDIIDKELSLQGVQRPISYKLLKK